MRATGAIEKIKIDTIKAEEELQGLQGLQGLQEAAYRGFGGYRCFGAM